MADFVVVKVAIFTELPVVILAGDFAHTTKNIDWRTRPFKEMLLVMVALVKFAATLVAPHRLLRVQHK